MDPLLRLLLVLVVLGGAFALVGWLSRRTRWRRPTDLPLGVTLVTGPDCALCEPARAALATAQPPIELHEVDVSDLKDRPRVLSLPTAVIVDADGRVVHQRSGRGVISDADEIAARADRLAHSS